ncbi:MAG TPA: 3-hydroxyisobutyrate dehydrogenase [Alphaproteobacteria bacterium]|nr:3-hydroxyisobutyrate dehydrogenase [Alphaproteobacteria bacterium]
MSRIAFIGLGNMGSGMAVNLAKAGHDVQAFDLSAEAVKRAEAAGAKGAASAAKAVEGADAVVTMLPAGKHVRAVYENEIFPAARPGTLMMDCSTIDVATARSVGEAAAAKGFDFVDAPVSGGVAAAEGGTLTFMVGGPEAAFKRAEAFLSQMGKAVIHSGDAGTGQAAKICNNMLLAILMSGTSEALALGVKNGLDPAVLSEIMKQSSGGNWALNVYNPWPGVMEGVPASRNYEGGFLVNLMTKDLGLAFDNAVKNQASIPMGSLARNLFQLHAGQGNGGLDFSSIQRLYKPE